ncbi:hypothetical protein KJ605_01005 [Patescibacteria group bacterium]|nr:hypothetical protein [Patescibacteria group bacterium]MBU1970343.1 hypothetical protein [Patescibacteria group bacterium]
MSLADDNDLQYALKKLLGALAKPVAGILIFIALVLFLMKAISSISVR